VYSPSESVNVGRVTVTTTPTLIRPAIGDRANCNVRNIGGADCDIGPSSSVTAGAAYPLYSASKDSLDIRWQGAIYAVTASGSTTIAYFEELT
jgi:hypothetical protein